MPAHSYGRAYLEARYLHTTPSLSGEGPQPTTGSLWRERCWAVAGPLLLLAGGLLSYAYRDVLQLEQHDWSWRSLLAVSALLTLCCVVCATICRAWHRLLCAPCLQAAKSNMSVLYSQM